MKYYGSVHVEWLHYGHSGGYNMLEGAAEVICSSKRQNSEGRCEGEGEGEASRIIIKTFDGGKHRRKSVQFKGSEHTWVEVTTEGSFAPFRNEILESASEGGQESTGSAGEGSYASEMDSYAEGAEPEQSVCVVNGVGDFDSIDFGSLTEADVKHFEFDDLQAAYEFYNEIKVHIDQALGRWYVEYFSDNHSHELLDWRFRGLMRLHRKVKDGDLHQISSMRKAGMRVQQFFEPLPIRQGALRP
ncbi:hypothetical protein PIB30_049736 [Stylosanthes scabra]|uniref:Uncharacterized protein n=1 Tax=Stylosanthes scabra TaxID=79078 RepID=A0ABU6UG38_9FABA|nr:hypothetical protein [Stylosanthes scabra]